MSLNLDQIFAGGQVPEWLRVFDADPNVALHDLLLGRSQLGHLTVAEPVELLRGWLCAFGKHGDFARSLDESLSAWIKAYWGQIELPDGASSASLTAVAWIRVTELLAAAPRLAASGQALTRHMLSDRRFLNSLAEGRSRDPQANAWLAVATHQQDRSLLAQWWQLCELPPNEPWYRGHCGIAGLRALPPESAARAGGFPKEVAEGLNRFGLALWRLQDEGWLDAHLAIEEFQDSLRLNLAAYPFPDRWLSFWRHVLRRDRSRGDISTWVQTLLPQIATGQPANRTQRPVWAIFDSDWPDRAVTIAEQLRKGVEGAVKNAERLLAEQRRYFDHSGDSSYLVRSATKFSAAIRRNKPAQALEWARLAKKAEPWNSYAWSSEGQALIALGDFPSAIAVCQETVRSFPDNVVAHNGLAKALKAQGRLEEAEAEYRETKERFPDNVYTRNGLAEVLKAQGRLEEAEAEYRETKERFPDDVYTRNGLPQVLKALGRLSDAEQEYRKLKAEFPSSIVPRNNLIAILKKEGRWDDVLNEYQEAMKIAPHHIDFQMGLGAALVTMNRFTEAENHYRQAKQHFPDKVFPYAKLAEILIEQGRLTEAEHEYREAKKYFPNDFEVWNGLVHVLHLQGRLDESDAEYRVLEKRFPHKFATPDTAHNVSDDITATSNSDAVPITPHTEKLTAVSVPPMTPTDRERPVDAPPETNVAPPLDRREIEILANDAFLVRGWARAARIYRPDAAPGYFRNRAKALLDRLLPAVDDDSVAAGESALLELDRGELEQALALLRRAAERFPGSARVRYALARAEREAAQGDPITPWRQLLRLDEHYEPIFFLGVGRTYLNRTNNGHGFAENETRDKLGRLAYWIRQRTKMIGDCDMSDPMGDPRLCYQARREGDFTGWWAREVQANLFGMRPIEGSEDLEDLEPIRKQALAHSNSLDRLEEELVLRFARA